MPKTMTKLELQLYAQILDAGLPEPEREYRFHELRQWRFDFAWPDQKVAAEVEGGVWTRGRHTRRSGFIGDCKKYNEATRLGWRVFRFTSCMLNSGEAIDTLEEALQCGPSD